MPVIIAGMDHRTVLWRFTGAVLGQGLLYARWCAVSGVMVQTVQKTVWRFYRCSSSSRSSTFFRYAEAVPLGPDYSADYRDFTVVRIWWSMSLFAGSFPRRRAEADSMVQTVRRTFFFLSEHGGRCPCCAGRACHTCCCQRQVREAQTLQNTLWFRSYCSSSSFTIPCCYAEVDPHGLRDHGDSTVAVLLLVVDVPVDKLCRFFVAVCVKTVRDPTVAACLPYSSCAWFDSGYKFMRRLRWLVLLVTFHLVQCSLPLMQAHEAWRHGRYAQQDICELGSGMSRLVLLVAMHLALFSLR